MGMSPEYFKIIFLYAASIVRRFQNTTMLIVIRIFCLCDAAATPTHHNKSAKFTPRDICAIFNAILNLKIKCRFCVALFF